MLYIIAGVSLSGKTTARSQITKTYGISGIDTDTLRTMTNVLRPDITVGHDKDTMTNYHQMRQTIQAFIHARSFFSEDFILEGDCLNLDDILININNSNVKAVVLGYPESSVEEVMLTLKNCSNTHWSLNVHPNQLEDKIHDFIQYSRFLREEANRLELTFIDVSHGLDSRQSTDLVIKNLFQL